MDDPGQARSRTALAWTRSALNMAGSGVLMARAGFTAHLDGLGTALAVGMSLLAAFTWLHGRAILRARGTAAAFPHHQLGALLLLTSATVLTALLAIVVTLGI